MKNPLELRLRQLVHRVDDLHINLQRVSSRTLSNSRTTSLEDRLQSLEQGQIPDTEPIIATQIFDDLTMQMSLFEKRLDALEKRLKHTTKNSMIFKTTGSMKMNTRLLPSMLKRCNLSSSNMTVKPPRSSLW